MRFFTQIWATPLLASLGLVLQPQPVYAYIDPGAGSYVFQMLIAGLVAAGFLVRQYWQKITKVFARRQPMDNGENEDS